MRATRDFNYKVALASGLKSLQAGRLRQAEEEFRYLVSKFPGLDGGYRGLAKVLIEPEDRPAALAILRDGASALAKGGVRDAAIALLRDALAIDPLDHGVHRRLSATLSNAGDIEGAVSEVHRYIDGQLVVGNVEHARQEIDYALKRFGDHSRLLDLAHRTAATSNGSAPESLAAAEEPGAAAEEPAAAAEPAATVEPVVVEQLPAERVDPATAEARAMELIAQRDPRAARVALEAAEWHLLEGRANAAADLLLQLVASETAGHDAQLLLVEVVRSSGKSEMAKTKCLLLAHVLRLKGNERLAGEVERLAEAV